MDKPFDETPYRVGEIYYSHSNHRSDFFAIIIKHREGNVPFNHLCIVLEGGDWFARKNEISLFHHSNRVQSSVMDYIKKRRQGVSSAWRKEQMIPMSSSYKFNELTFDGISSISIHIDTLEDLEDSMVQAELPSDKKKFLRAFFQQIHSSFTPLQTISNPFL